MREDFEERGQGADVVDLRFKHFQGRLIDTLNRVLDERLIIKHREHVRENKASGLEDFSSLNKTNMNKTAYHSKSGAQLIGPHTVKIPIANKS